GPASVSSDIADDLLKDPGVGRLRLDPASCGDLSREQLAGLTEELVCQRLARPGGETPLALQTVADDLGQAADLTGHQLLLREAATPRRVLDWQCHVGPQREPHILQLRLPAEAAQGLACPDERERHRQPALEDEDDPRRLLPLGGVRGLDPPDAV